MSKKPDGLSRPLGTKAKTDKKKPSGAIASRIKTQMLDEEVIEQDEDSNFDPDEERERISLAFAMMRDDDDSGKHSRQRLGTVKHIIRKSNSMSDNQSMIADLADDCETKRINNDNYRLDMTWADQESQRKQFLQAIDSSAPLCIFTHKVLLG